MADTEIYVIKNRRRHQWPMELCLNPKVDPRSKDVVSLPARAERKVKLTEDQLAFIKQKYVPKDIFIKGRM